MPAGADPTSEILIYGDPRLRRVARPVRDDEDLGDLSNRLMASMLASDGVGLAAPQVGDMRRVVAVADPTVQPLRPLVMINPVVEELFGPTASFEEGCLSFPGLYLSIWRQRGVQVGYRDVDGASHVLRDDGILGRVVQHEVDHLDGIVFVDRLPLWRRWLLVVRLRKLRRLQGLPEEKRT